MRALSRLGLMLLVILVCLAPSLSAGVIVIDSMANIFGAGYGTAPGGGLLPSLVSFGEGTVVSVQFTSVTGTVDCASNPSLTYCAAVGGDGGANTGPLTGTNMAVAGDGLSGINYIGRYMFLIGVFLTSDAPSGGDPANFLTYNNTLAAGASFSPGLGQLFVVGDGQGTSGTQTFYVPSGATRLFLGFADGTPFFGTPSTPASPGAYGDNVGALTATYEFESSIPEPGTAFLLGLGIAGLALFRRKRA